MITLRLCRARPGSHPPSPRTSPPRTPPDITPPRLNSYEVSVLLREGVPDRRDRGGEEVLSTLHVDEAVKGQLRLLAGRAVERHPCGERKGLVGSKALPDDRVDTGVGLDEVLVARPRASARTRTGRRGWSRSRRTAGRASLSSFRSAPRPRSAPVRMRCRGASFGGSGCRPRRGRPAPASGRCCPIRRRVDTPCGRAPPTGRGGPPGRRRTRSRARRPCPLPPTGLRRAAR